MKLLQDARRWAGTLLSPRALTLLLAAVAGLFLLPTSALAAGAEGNVRLVFSDADKIYLYISLGLGFLALVFAGLIAKWVTSKSPGGPNMQAVGKAIEEGALAYLRKQVATMSIFVVILAIGLGVLFTGEYNSAKLGGLIAFSFVAGVAASYIAGYTGMLLAVRGNMRTANAALTSYKSSLEIAFRSGAVAGLVTVGMGLLGATLIFLFAGADAMKLLVGFGFGGSLAALFMRVGGGIFTKAADVGADLVGKVEAGIPEDDPRNPATIADNVGDNVGDCAGMAADVFESYEVTLVAAIVLGAATAAIFDQQTWMRLILFALMARGAGIIASIIGIYSVKGSDNIDADPLKAIRKGFYASAAIASVLTLGLAYFMMGGNGNAISTSQFVPLQNINADQRADLLAARNRIAATKNVAPSAVDVKDLAATPEAKAMNLDSEEARAQLSQAARTTGEELKDLRQETPFSRIDPNATNIPALGYAVPKPPANPAAPSATPEFITLAQALKENQIQALLIEQKQQPAAQGQTPPPPQPPFWFITQSAQQIEEQIKASNGQFAILERQNVVPFVNEDGKVGFGIPTKTNTDRIQGQVQIIGATPEAVSARLADQNSTEPFPAQETPFTGVVRSNSVPWYMFFAAIFFGILMAFAIEMLTDYYVSTHKKPVQEVAGVSSAGPAPMIIQGFSYAAESSVFMVFAIVFALLVPLYLFNPVEYGGYILSFYGIALVGLGLLTTTGYVLAMDTFGPISDNAQGVYEMSGEGHYNEMGSKAVQRLDAAGNTTKALTKGFAIATAVVAAVALFHSYLADAKLGELGLRLDFPEIFLGLLIGGAAPYLFSAFSINAVGRASFELINEVRRQFRNDPGIMAGTSKPDYGRCVAIVTRAAQKELLGPGILAIALPVAVAFGFSIGKTPTSIGGEMYNLTGAQALGGFLAGAILSGQLMAVLLANSGGMWDNAKKLIEDGLYGGKGSDAHKAGVVCDTVGDPFKDTAGPALNPLIKVMNLVALLLAPVVIEPYSNTVLVIITVVAVAALAFSIFLSKKGSMSSGLQAAQASGAQAADHVLSQPERPSVGSRRITVDDAVPSDEDKTEA